MQQAQGHMTRYAIGLLILQTVLAQQDIRNGQLGLEKFKFKNTYAGTQPCAGTAVPLRCTLSA